MWWPAFSLLLACAPEAADPPPSGEVSLPAGFSWGPVAACPAPVDLGWFDASDALGGAGPSEGGDEVGFVGLIGSGSGAQVLASMPGGLGVARRGDGALHPIDAPAGAAFALVEDLDEDGEDDLLTWGLSVAVDWGLDPAARQTLLVAQEGLFPQDVALVDADGDGLRDLVVAFHDEVGDGEAPTHPALLQGRGGREFAAAEALLPAVDGWGAAFDITALDWDGDAWTDLLVCNDGPSTQTNQVLCGGPDGLAPCAARGADVSLFCMGVSVEDVDGDELDDLVIAASDTWRLLLGSEAGFVDVTEARVGLPYAPGEMSWGSDLVDLDNDGHTDILLANGDFSTGTDRWPLWALRQEADGRFTEAGAGWGMPQATGGRGVLTNDLNEDGVLDVLLGDMGRPPHLLLSTGCTAESWLEVEAPVGARVLVEADGQRWTRRVTRDPGYGVSGPARVHVGLGEAEAVERLTVTMPGGAPAVLEGPFAARRRVTWGR